jgi:hypothetical protein
MFLSIFTNKSKSAADFPRKVAALITGMYLLHVFSEMANKLAP